MKQLASEKNIKEQWLIQLGGHIRKQRLKKGMTGGQLARELLIDKSNLIRIEKGRVNTSVFTIKQICDVLGISMKEFWKDF